MPDLSSTDLVQRVRDMLGYTPYETTSTTTGTGTTVAVVDGTRWDEGAIGEWQTGTVGYEQFYVQTVAVNNLTVVRGYNGTTAEAHTSGDRVLRIDNDGFSGRQLQQAINQSVLDLWPWVWKTGTVSLTYAGTTKWYNLNALTLGVVGVKQQKNSTTTDVGIFKDRYYGNGLTYLVRRDLPTAVVASTNGMTFPSGVYDTRDPGANAILVTDVRAVTGATDAVAEVEAVTLDAFSGVDSFKLTWNAVESAIITRGTNYTAAGIKAVIEGISGFVGPVTVSSVSDDGFLVTWAIPGAQALAPLSVTSGVGVTGDVVRVPAGSAATTTGDIKDTSNLPVAEAVVYGAVARLMRASEIRRVTFGSPLEAVQTSGTGARLQLSGFYEDQYRKRLEELSVRLRQLYTPDSVWS